VSHRERTPAEHALVRDLSIYTPSGRLRVFRRDRRTRPDAAYQCSCGFPIPGAVSRRQARPLHHDHRVHVRLRGALRSGAITLGPVQ
jgi:hypothetical protein